MRHLFIIITIGIVFLSLAALTAIRADVESDLPRFDPEQEQGDVKVTLLQVSRVTTFSRQDLMEEAGDHVRAIPGVEVLYLVERTGDAPLGLMTIGGLKCFVNGEQVQTVGGVVGGGNSIVTPREDTIRGTDFAVPEVEAPDRASLRWHYLRGVSPKGDRADLHIEVGFDGLQTFVFESVPLH